jgi:hypothetical protein
MPAAELQAMPNRFGAKSIAVLAEVNAFVHRIVRVMPLLD